MGGATDIRPAADALSTPPAPAEIVPAAAAERWAGPCCCCCCCCCCRCSTAKRGLYDGSYRPPTSTPVPAACPSTRGAAAAGSRPSSAEPLRPPIEPNGSIPRAPAPPRSPTTPPAVVPPSPAAGPTTAAPRLPSSSTWTDGSYTVDLGRRASVGSTVDAFHAAFGPVPAAAAAPEPGRCGAVMTLPLTVGAALWCPPPAAEEPPAAASCVACKAHRAASEAAREEATLPRRPPAAAGGGGSAAPPPAPAPEAAVCPYQRASAGAACPGPKACARALPSAGAVPAGRHARLPEGDLEERNGDAPSR